MWTVSLTAASPSSAHARSSLRRPDLVASTLRSAPSRCAVSLSRARDASSLEPENSPGPPHSSSPRREHSRSLSPMTLASLLTTTASWPESSRTLRTLRSPRARSRSTRASLTASSTRTAPSGSRSRETLPSPRLSSQRSTLTMPPHLQTTAASLSLRTLTAHAQATLRWSSTTVDCSLHPARPSTVVRSSPAPTLENPRRRWTRLSAAA
mmetsp:Transcript_17528/g.34457  ORF Transcript_17528/g.34457 Transcript_17528/m.34457 type:complete len:210 (+) Transcript_17528:1137-1766(+)